MSEEPIEVTLNIQTPENVAFGYQVAGIGARFLAALIDTTLLLLLQMALGVVLLVLARSLGGELWRLNETLIAWLVAAFGLLSFAFLWGYYIFFELTMNGQSPGKRRVGLRVIRADGTPLTLTESIIRNLVRLVDFLPGYYGIGVVTMFVDSQSRRLGDLAAGTLVVFNQAPVTLESLTATPKTVTHYEPIFPAVRTLPLERLTDTDLQWAENFWARRPALVNRPALAAQLLQRFLAKMETPAEVFAGQAPEVVLGDIMQAARSRGEG